MFLGELGDRLHKRDARVEVRGARTLRLGLPPAMRLDFVDWKALTAWSTALVTLLSWLLADVMLKLLAVRVNSYQPVLPQHSRLNFEGPLGLPQQLSISLLSLPVYCYSGAPNSGCSVGHRPTSLASRFVAVRGSLL